MPINFTVTTPSDDTSTVADGTTSGSLRQGILNADASGGGTILVDADESIVPSAALPAITQSITIQQINPNLRTLNSADTTTIAGGATLTLNGVDFINSNLLVDGHLVEIAATVPGGFTAPTEVGLISGSGDISGGPWLLLDGSGTATFSGNIDLSSSGEFNLDGPGTQILTGTISTASLRISDGVLDISHATLNLAGDEVVMDSNSPPSTLVALSSQLNNKTIVFFSSGSILDLVDVPFGTDSVTYDSVAGALDVMSGATLIATMPLEDPTISDANPLVVTDDGAGGTDITVADILLEGSALPINLTVGQPQNLAGNIGKFVDDFPGVTGGVTVTISYSGTGATLSVGNGSVAGSVAGQGTGSVTLTGSQSAINADLQALSITSTLATSGTLTVAADDHVGHTVAKSINVAGNGPFAVPTFTVTSFGDDGSTVANSATSGTLRQGILNAEAAGGGVIAVDGTSQDDLTMITLTSPLPTFTGSITIEGAIGNGVQISIPGSATIASGATLAMEGVEFFSPFVDNGHLIALGGSEFATTTDLISGSGDISDLDDGFLEISTNSGTSTFTGNITETSDLGIRGGTQIFTGTIQTHQIFLDGGFVDLHAAHLVNELTIDFSFGNATLVANAAQLTTPTVRFFTTPGPDLDLADVPFGTETVVYDSVSGSLRVMSGATVVDVISLGTPGTAINFQTTDDNHGGTNVFVATPALTLSAGASSVHGTAGNDTIVAAAGTLGSLTSIDGGAGVNTLQLTGPGTFDLTQPALLANIQRVIATASNGPDTVTLRSGLNVSFGASNLGDTVIGGNAHDTIFGGTGNDSMTAITSGNWLIGNGGNDTLIASSAGGDTLLGGVGNDRMVSNSAVGTANLLIGKEGTDSGNDTLIGGAGHDTLVGHNGNDSIVGGNGGNFLIGGYPGSTGNPTLLGGTGDDTIFAASGASSLSAGSGNDELIGQGGNDTIVAGTGNDTIFGHGGLGGSDANIYVVASGETVLIADFLAGSDRIDVGAYHFANFAALQAAANITVADNGVILTLPSGLNLTIIGETSIHAGDFVL